MWLANQVMSCRTGQTLEWPAPASAAHQFGFADTFKGSIVGQQVPNTSSRIDGEHFIDGGGQIQHAFGQGPVRHYGRMEMPRQIGTRSKRTLERLRRSIGRFTGHADNQH